MYSGSSWQSSGRIRHHAAGGCEARSPEAIPPREGRPGPQAAVHQ